MDIEDNADALRLRHGLDLIIDALDGLLTVFADRIEEYADLPVMAFTHIQPAEPTTLGYRLGIWAQDLLDDRQRIAHERGAIRGKGFKGAVGTSASYAELVGPDHVQQFEQRLSEELGLAFYPLPHRHTRASRITPSYRHWPGSALRCTNSPWTCASCSRLR